MENPKQAFDVIAGEYDQTFTNTGTGREQRKKVHHHLEQLLQRADIERILEVNCGTGEDACWLAQKEKRVLSTDISPQMIATAERKRQLLPEGIRQHLQLQCIAVNDIKATPLPYDLLLSNFGGLNCLSPIDLNDFLSNAAQLVRPDGYLVLVIMGRFCWWETLYFLLKGNIAQAFRRWRRRATGAALDNSTSIPTWYYSPNDILRGAKLFKKQALFPIGFWLPPSYLDPFFKRYPGVFNWLAKLESSTGVLAWPAYASDHYYLVLQRKA